MGGGGGGGGGSGWDLFDIYYFFLYENLRTGCDIHLLCSVKTEHMALFAIFLFKL